MASKASASDPRRPEAIVPWVPLKPHPNDVPFDYWSLLGMGFGVAALVLRIKYAGWAALFCCLVSMATAKGSDGDRQGSSAIMMAIMGIVTNYMPGIRQAAEGGASSSS